MTWNDINTYERFFELEILDASKTFWIKSKAKIELREFDGFFTDYGIYIENGIITLFHMDRNSTSLELIKFNQTNLETECEIIQAKDLFNNSVNLRNLVIKENIMFIVFCDENQTLGLGTFKLSNMQHPQEQFIIKGSNELAIDSKVFIENKKLYIAHQTGPEFPGRYPLIETYDFSNISSIHKIGTLIENYMAFYISIFDESLYLLDYNNFKIFEIVEGVNLTQLGSYQNGPLLWNMVFNEHRAYINQDRPNTKESMIIIDCENQTDLKYIDTFSRKKLTSD